MSPYFTGPDLESTMKAATGRDEAQRRQRCQRLYSDLGSAESKLSSLERDIQSLKNQVERLRADRKITAIIGASLAIASTVGPLGTALKGIRTASRTAGKGKSGGNIVIDLLTIVPVVGGLVTAAATLARVAHLNSAIATVARDAESLKREAESIETTLRVLRSHYTANRCDRLTN